MQFHNDIGYSVFDRDGLILDVFLRRVREPAMRTIMFLTALLLAPRGADLGIMPLPNTGPFRCGRRRHLSTGRQGLAGNRLVAMFTVATSWTAVFAPSQAAVIATSGFNDQVGINSNANPNSPFTIGVTVNGQGVGEAGWDGPWERRGGGDERAPVSSEFVYEGDAAIKLFADTSVGTSIERPWFNIVPKVRIDTYVLVRPGAQMRGNAVFSSLGGEVAPRTVAYWDIAHNGQIQVFNKATNQTINTGFSTLPNAWNKYSLIVDTPAQTWKFLFNDQEFRPAQPLQFLNESNYVDRVNLMAAGTLNSYVDAVQVSSLPALPGDFNGDLVVDAADYPLWRRLFAELVPACSGPDANCNGAVDKNDYQIWRSNFGRTLGGASVATSAAVPEPGSLVLCSLSAIALLAKRRLRKG
jgi:hypothetical protein